jgi:glycosyltransferase involved in cell wall biosynthesis
MPSISIIVAVYNGIGTLERCFQSVIEQTHPDTHLLVIDGGSTDGSRQLIEAYAGHIDYWISEPDRGVYHAWNKALAQLSSDWALFLGADDRFPHPETLARVAPALAAAPAECPLVYGRMEIVDTGGGVVNRIGQPWEACAARFRGGDNLPTPATFFRREALACGFDESFRIAADYALLLKLLRNATPGFADERITLMEIGGLSTRHDLTLLSLRETQRARWINGYRLPSRWWLKTYAHYLVHGVFVRVLGRERTHRWSSTVKRRLGLTPTPNAVEIANPLPLGEGRVREQATDVSTDFPQASGAKTLTPPPLPKEGVVKGRLG